MPSVENVDHARQHDVGDLGLHKDLAQMVEHAHVVSRADVALGRVLRMQAHYRIGHELVEPRDFSQLRMRVIRETRTAVEHERVILVVTLGGKRGMNGLLVNRSTLEAAFLENLRNEFHLPRRRIESVLAGTSEFANLVFLFYVVLARNGETILHVLAQFSDRRACLGYDCIDGSFDVAVVALFFETETTSEFECDLPVLFGFP